MRAALAKGTFFCDMAPQDWILWFSVDIVTPFGRNNAAVLAQLWENQFQWQRWIKIESDLHTGMRDCLGLEFCEMTVPQFLKIYLILTESSLANVSTSENIRNNHFNRFGLPWVGCNTHIFQRPHRRIFYQASFLFGSSCCPNPKLDTRQSHHFEVVIIIRFFHRGQAFTDIHCISWATPGQQKCTSSDRQEYGILESQLGCTPLVCELVILNLEMGLRAIY